ncbi:MAG: ABC transporter permease [Candidatus Acidiferrales bacterium]
MRIPLQDLRFALRMLARNKAFTVVVVLTLALGIAANTTIFSWINATLLTPIPGVSRPSEIVAVENGRAGSFSYPDFLDLHDRTKSFAGLTAFAFAPASLTGDGKPERVWATMVTANYFDVLGVKPAFGRGFLTGEDKSPNGAPVAVISDLLWQRRFGADTAIVGRIIHLNTRPFTIVGVATPEFQGSTSGLRFDLWVPLTAARELAEGGKDLLDMRGTDWLNVLGRLNPGLGREQAQTESTGILQQIASQFPDSHRGVNQVTLYPLWRAPNGANAFFSTLLPILMGVAGVVLLLACSNVANLLLLRGLSRRKEMCIRLSLGAGRFRLIRQLFVENMLLSFAAGGIALPITMWTSSHFMDFAPMTDFPIWISVAVDHRVLLATFTVTLASGMLFGILPALRASGMNPASALKDESGALAGGRSKARLSTSLAVAQIALSLTLLVSAGLFIRSFHATQNFDPGFNPRNVLLASYDLFPNGYKQADGVRFHRQVLDNIEAVPGVLSAGLADWVPLGFVSNSDSFTPEGYVAGPHEAVSAGVARVSPGYLATVGIPLLTGRDFTPHDSSDSQAVVIINDALAGKYWPNQNPIGKRIRVEEKWAIIIGEARTTRYYDLNERPQPFLYLPLYQFYSSAVILHVRTATDPLSSSGAIAQAVHKLNADLPVFDVSLMTARIGVSSFVQRMAGTFVGAFGIIALVLAAAGIYSVIAYGTKRRTHEVGIRMTLGAQRKDVLRLILGQGAKITMLGVAIGLAATFALTRLMASLLFGVSATDLVTFVSVAVLLTIIALAASYIPALRATRVDPVVALKYE